MADINAIEVKHLSKDFILPHHKIGSVKGLFTSIFRGISKGSEVQHALKDITFQVKKGEFFGIVGRNGSGKSTLLKILAGIYQPSEGSIQTRGRLVPFIELGVGFNPELTGRENVFLNGAILGFSNKEIQAMYDDIVSFAELERFMDQKLKNYSSGMQVRLAFAMATRSEADILLVDEVLAVGDAAFQRKCFEYFKELKANKKTVVFVTHDMSAVREYCDRAMLIDENELKYIGNPQDIAKEYAMLFMDEIAKEDFHKRASGDRWGNGAVSIVDVSAKIEKDELVVRVKANVQRGVDRVIYGLHIIGQDGAEITAMNNRMIQKDDVGPVVEGDTILFEWHMLNVFNDGKYFVTLTLIDDVANTLDWFTKAARFTVVREDRSTTPVMPPVQIQTNIKTGSKHAG